MANQKAKEVGRNEPCPCGSGKKFKECCLSRETSGMPSTAEKLRPLIIIAIVLVLGAAAYALISREQPEPTTSPRTMTIPSQTTTPQMPPGETPPPYFYDEANNQHWDPGHNHWHSGPPPANAGQTGAQPIQTQPKNQSPIQQPPMQQQTMPATPAIQNPQPYQYDPATNQYWDPGHGHWHQGRPPEQPPAQP